MTDTHFLADAGVGDAMRKASAVELATALSAGRSALLALVKAYRQALGDELSVRYSAELNLPLWELGHIGWFEEHWIRRNLLRHQGAATHVEAMLISRPASRFAAADDFYDSSNVAHTQRWQLALPSIEQTLGYLEAVRTDTLKLLQSAEESDAGLYFYRLALFHEAMHREAWIYMAQNLGVALDITVDATPASSFGDLQVSGGPQHLGFTGTGFAFDNELDAHPIEVPAFAIDRQQVSWERYLPFVEAGGYLNQRYWSREGWAWRAKSGVLEPRFVRRQDGRWQRQHFGQWQPLDTHSPAIHLSFFEAEAWCRWAGRRLPTEEEWERAACTAPPNDFTWGSVWEWTASAFVPYPGFTPHPYRDYSAPWFDGRPVLRGASFATDPIMRHRSYRNFFPAERNDIYSGFRSCSA